MSIDTIVRSAVVATAVVVSATTALAQAGPTADEIKSISEEAIIYGLPMSMYYKYH